MQIALALFAALTIALLVAGIRQMRANAAIREALSISASGTGESFFRSLVTHLARALHADFAAISELSPSGTRLRSVAVVMDGRLTGPLEYDLAKTPCAHVIATSRCVIPDHLQSMFPVDPISRNPALRSYLGVALVDSAGATLGVISVMSRRRLRHQGTSGAILDVLAQRASAEMERRRSEQARQASEAKTQAILQAIPDLMFVQDRSGTFVDYYAAAAGTLYVSPDRFIGRRFHDVLPPEAVAAIAPAFTSVVESGESATVEYQLGDSGEGRFFEARMVRLAPDNVLSIVRDLTDRKRAEQALERSRYFAQRLAETIPNVVFLYDLAERRNVFVNDRSEAVIGYTAEEVVAMGDQFLTRAMHPDDLALVKRLPEQYARAKDGEVLEHVFRFRHKNGEWRWISRSATVFTRAADGRPAQILGSAIDVTQLKAAEEELRTLSARLRNTQDEERRRIARELHDGVAQSLFGIGAFLATLRQSSAGHDATALAECVRLCDEGLREVRLLSYMLHPPMLDEAGLALALHWFTEGLERRSGLEIAVEAEETMDRLPLAVERDLFRIVQEGLSNVIRHSGSRKAVVRLDRQPNRAVLQIQDFGRGMPAPFGSGDAMPQPVGVGILGMRERLRHVGGRLEIDSTPQGTTLTAIVPLGGQ
jgi:PAS domain S-box-containing protein